MEIDEGADPRGEPAHPPTRSPSVNDHELMEAASNGRLEGPAPALTQPSADSALPLMDESIRPEEGWHGGIVGGGCIDIRAEMH